MFENKMANDNEIFLFALLVTCVLRLRRRRNTRKTIRPTEKVLGEGSLPSATRPRRI